MSDRRPPRQLPRTPRKPAQTPLAILNFRRPPSTSQVGVARKPSSSVVAWGWYVDGVRQECTDLDLAAAEAKEGNGWVWLGLKDPTEEEMENFGTLFELHPLAIEDAVEGHDRSKIEQFDDTLFAVVSTVRYVDHASLTESAEIVSTGQIMVFVGDGFALTVRRGEHSQLGNMRRRLETDDDQILRQGPSAVLYGVMDKIVNDYNGVVDEMEADIDELEEMTFSAARIHSVDQVYQLKRELIEFKRAVLPLGMPLMQLATRSYAQVPEEMQAYFREVSDHHVDTREAIGSFDDILNSFLQAAIARASLEDNQDMRKISALVSILAVPTMVFGWYGMNFRYMPELEQPWGYPLVLCIVFTSMLLIAAWFRKKKWL